MNTHITDKNCIGCLACENICPRRAITHDISSGFIRPIIDEVVCVKCGLCSKVCPKDAVLEEGRFLQQAYAVKRGFLRYISHVGCHTLSYSWCRWCSITAWDSPTERSRLIRHGSSFHLFFDLLWDVLSPDSPRNVSGYWQWSC